MDSIGVKATFSINNKDANGDCSVYINHDVNVHVDSEAKYRCLR